MSISAKMSAARDSRFLDLSFERLNRNILELALPAVAENVLMTAVFFVDTFLIGWLRDPCALAAVGITHTLLMLVQSVFMALAVAATTMVAQLWGARKDEEAARVAGQAVSMTVVTATAMSALAWVFTPTLFRLMGASAETTQLGSSYMRIILLTSFAGYSAGIFNGIMRGSGDTRTPMYITGAMNVWNLIAAALLVFGPGPFPALGLMGAGLATASARLLAGILGWAVLLRGRGRIRILARDMFRWDAKTLRTMARLSLPTAGEALGRQMGSVLVTSVVSSLGDIALAAHQIALAVESLSFMPNFGLSIAGTTLVGQSLGANKIALAEKSIRRVLMFSILFMSGLGVVFALFGPAIAVIFGATPEVVGAAGVAIRISALEQIPLAVGMTLGGCLRGAGDTKSPMYSTLLGVILFRMPLVYLFAIVLGWGLGGVWFATALDFAGRMVILYLLFRRGAWKTARVA